MNILKSEFQLLNVFTAQWAAIVSFVLYQLFIAMVTILIRETYSPSTAFLKFYSIINFRLFDWPKS